jgi:hypothetical protein
MPFDKDLASRVDEYARSDLAGDLAWHVQRFSFLADDPPLRQRVGEEFYAARYLYKLLEGLRLAESWAQATQVRLQILQYASIYEACLHHVLFVTCEDEPEVRSLGIYRALKRYSVPAGALRQLQHDGKEIIPAFESESKAPESKVRFEDKVDAAIALGAIERPLGAELKDLYEARNSIHLHAELKKDLSWSLELGRIAYRRMEPFCDELAAFVRTRSQGQPSSFG